MYYTVFNKTKTLVNKNKTAVNPRIPVDNFLGLSPFDLVFAWNTPHELYLTGRDVYADRCLSADARRYGGYDLALTIMGKKKRLYRTLFNSPKGLEVDHISRNPHDVRPENMRTGTKEQNLWNRDTDQGEVLQHKNGRYFVRFPLEPDVSKTLYERYEDAEAHLHELQDKYYGEFGKRRSQEIADKYDTHLFDDIFLNMFSPADHKLINEIESMPYIFDMGDTFYFNEARIGLHLLNATYMHLLTKAKKALIKDMRSASSPEERAESCRILTWLQDGRYIINLGYFLSRFDDIVAKHLAYMRACEHDRSDSVTPDE